MEYTKIHLQSEIMTWVIQDIRKVVNYFRGDKIDQNESQTDESKAVFSDPILAEVIVHLIPKVKDAIDRYDQHNSIVNLEDLKNN